MGKKIPKNILKEHGNITLLFAVSLVVLIFFIGLSLDVGMVYMQRSELISLLQVAKEDRFTYQDSIRYADNPGLMTYQVAADTLDANGFDGELKVFFKEEPPKYHRREYQMRLQLSKEYSFTFLKIFGQKPVNITVSQDGGETYGEGGSDVIWYPPLSPANYNGCYTRKADRSFSFSGGVLPGGW